MPDKLLKKGLEIELYAGKESGEVLPLSKLLSQNFKYISQEPDQRNFEYITTPLTDYSEIFKQVVEKRSDIRNFLKSQGGLTLIPGSTMFLPFSKDFHYSKENDPYHKFISETYKTKVITTSIHINIGVEDKENLFKLLCALRLDTPIFLALSASSPFCDGKVTNHQSYRWHSFPKIPEFVPFFTSHQEYIGWINEKLKSKEMLNVRHLWTSIRPNGPNRPYDLDRIEIRICDLVADPLKMLGIVSLIECMAQTYLLEGNWPKVLDGESSDLNTLVQKLNEQEETVARDGLNANILDWRKDTTAKVSEIVQELYKKYESIAKRLEILNYLKTILDILKDGNESMQFIEFYKKNKSISKTIAYFTEQFTNMDLKYTDMWSVIKK